MKKLFPCFLLLGLTGCMNSKYPTFTRDYDGLVMACYADSTTLLNDTLIRLKKRVSKRYQCINCIFRDCSTKPVYLDFLHDWPGIFTFHFKEKTYYFLNNSTPYHEDIQYGEKGFEVHYDLDNGSVRFSKRKKTITLVSEKYKAARTFNYNYSEKDSVLTLTILPLAR